jgi:hypothetical protein
LTALLQPVTTILMWLSGRRAVRPDRDVYRSLRRQSLRSPRGTSSGPGMQFLALAAMALLCLLGWFLFR